MVELDGVIGVNRGQEYIWYFQSIVHLIYLYLPDSCANRISSLICFGSTEAVGGEENIT